TVEPAERWVERRDFDSITVAIDATRDFDLSGAIWLGKVVDLDSGAGLDSIEVSALEGTIDVYTGRGAWTMSSQDGSFRLMVSSGSLFWIAASDPRATRVPIRISADKDWKIQQQENEAKYGRVHSLRIDNVVAGGDSTFNIRMEPVVRP